MHPCVVGISITMVLLCAGRVDAKRPEQQAPLAEAKALLRAVEQINGGWPVTRSRDIARIERCFQAYDALYHDASHGIARRFAAAVPTGVVSDRDLDTLFGYAFCMDWHAGTQREGPVREAIIRVAITHYERYIALDQRTDDRAVRQRTTAQDNAHSLQFYLPQGAAVADMPASAYPDVATISPPSDEDAGTDREPEDIVVRGSIPKHYAVVESFEAAALAVERGRQMRAEGNYAACHIVYQTAIRQFDVDAALTFMREHHGDIMDSYATRAAAQFAPQNGDIAVQPAMIISLDITWGVAVCEFGEALAMIDAGAGKKHDPRFGDTIARLEDARDRYAQYAALEFRYAHRERGRVAHAQFEHITGLLAMLLHQEDPWVFAPEEDPVEPTAPDVTLVHREAADVPSDPSGAVVSDRDPPAPEPELPLPEPGDGSTPAAGPPVPVPPIAHPDIVHEPPAQVSTPPSSVPQPRYKVVYDYTLRCGTHYVLTAIRIDLQTGVRTPMEFQTTRSGRECSEASKQTSP